MTAATEDRRERGRRTVVMTGATSGFGGVAADRIRRAGAVRLITGARRPETTTGDAFPLDLTTLDSVRSFAASTRERLDGTPVDALVLNAGVIHPDATGRTVDGFETTFAVNHLAHFLLLRLVQPVLSDGATVVITTSGTHDPAAGAGLSPPRHADAVKLAYPDRDLGRELRPRKAGEHAYTASKLCAVLTTRALAARAAAEGRRLTAVAYCPGQVFGTGLAQNLSLPRRVAWSVLGTPLGWTARRLLPTLNSRTAAGRALADLVLGDASPPSGRNYAALRGARLSWPDPSALALRDDLAGALWHDSCRLVGLGG